MSQYKTVVLCMMFYISLKMRENMTFIYRYRFLFVMLDGIIYILVYNNDSTYITMFTYLSL